LPGARPLRSAFHSLLVYRHWQSAAASVRAELTRQLTDSMNQIVNTVNDGTDELTADELRACFKCCSYLSMEASLAAQSAHVAELVQASGKAVSKGVSISQNLVSFTVCLTR